MGEQSEMRNVEMEQLTSEDEWEFEVEGYNAEDAKVEPALLVIVRQEHLSVSGKGFVLLRVLEQLRGYSEGLELSVQEGALPCADRVKEEPCWLVRAGDADGTGVLRRHCGVEIKVPSSGVPDFPRGGKAEIVVECGDMLGHAAGGGGPDPGAMLEAAKGLPSCGALGLGLFTGAAILGCGIVRDVQGMPWVQGPIDVCAMTIERCLAKQAARQGYTLELLPCTDSGSSCCGRKLEKAAPAGKRPSDKVSVAFGGKFRFRAKPIDGAAGAVVKPLKLSLRVAFPQRGVGTVSGDSKVKVTLSSTAVDVFYCSSSGMQACFRTVASGVSSVRAGDVGASVFHAVGTGATDGLGAGWAEGRVPVPRTRVRVDPGKRASAINAVRAASGEARSFYDEAVCLDFVPRLAKSLSKGRDPAGRSVKERAVAGLAALGLGQCDTVGKDLEACLKAACRGGCGLFPCLPASVLRAGLAQAKLSELGGGNVAVSGASVVMPSGGGGRAGGATLRGLGKSSRAARDGEAEVAGGEAAFDFSGVPPAGLSGAERKAEAAAEVNTRAAVARASAQVNGFLQQGWEHLCAAEAEEVVAALAEAIRGGDLPLHVVHSVQDLQDAVSELLGDVRRAAAGYAREVSVLRANRCRVVPVKFRADGQKRARRGSGAGAAVSSEASDAGDGASPALSAVDKEKVWDEFLEMAYAVYSQAATFGFVSAAEAAGICAALAKGECTVEGDAAKFEEIVRAGYGQLERAGCVKASFEVSGQSAPSYTLGTEAFLGTVSGQAVVGGA